MPSIVTLRLLHGLQQGGLRLGGGAVDLVGEQELREAPGRNRKSNWPSVGASSIDVRADDVGGHQVGRELDAVEAAAEHVGQRADQQRLAQAGHAFEQDVAAGEQRGEQPLDDRVLADDHPLQLIERAFEPGARIPRSLAWIRDWRWIRHIRINAVQGPLRH